MNYIFNISSSLYQFDTVLLIGPADPEHIGQLFRSKAKMFRQKEKLKMDGLSLEVEVSLPGKFCSD
jgi:hypothetical protein